MRQQSPADRGKRTAYLVVLSLGLLATLVLTAVEEDAVLRALHAGVVVPTAVVLVGLATRRLPMSRADWLVFSIVAGALGITLLRVALDPAAAPLRVLLMAVMMWACLLFPLAFLVFGTRQGVRISAVTWLIFVTGAALTVRSATRSDPGLATELLEIVGHAALAYGALVALLWVLSARLELLVRERTRADLLATEATTDALTGVANRRRLTDDLDRLIAQATRHSQPLSVALVDLDEFKRVNDQFGHGEGDNVLIDTVRRLKRSLRAGDIIGRWGGEEFLLILPHTDLTAAAELADRCRRALATEPSTHVGVVSASFGAAMLSVDDDRRTLLRRADLALYSAKREGRDRVAVLPSLDGLEELPTVQVTHPT